MTFGELVCRRPHSILRRPSSTCETKVCSKYTKTWQCKSGLASDALASFRIRNRPTYATGSPASCVETLDAARDAIAALVQKDADAMCGTITAFGMSFKPGFMSGSSSKTSRPARNSGFLRRCSTRATVAYRHTPILVVRWA